MSREILAGRPGCKLPPIRLCLMLVLLTAAACSGGDPVVVATVERGPFRVSVVTSGELRAVENLTLTAPAMAGEPQVVFLVEEGSLVEKGDVLAVFDAAGAEDQLRGARASVAEAEATRQQLEAERDIALRELENRILSTRVDLERARKEVAKGDLLPRSDLELAVLEVERLEVALNGLLEERADQRVAWESKIAVQDTAIGKAAQEVGQARTQLDRLELVAPRDGLVVLGDNWAVGEQRKVQEGDRVWPGMEVLSLPDLTTMEVLARVNEIEAGRVREGQSVRLRLDAFPEREYLGTVERVGRLALQLQGRGAMKVVDVVVELEQTDPETMKPGMSCQVEIFQEEIAEALTVPIEAVFEGDDGGDVAFLERGRGFRQTEVELGPRNLTHVVVESGLEEGSRVALSDPRGDDHARGGAEARPVERAESPGAATGSDG